MKRILHPLAAAAAAFLLVIVAASPAQAYTTSQWFNGSLTNGSSAQSPLGTHVGGEAFIHVAGFGNTRLNTIQGSGGTLYVTTGGTNALITHYHPVSAPTNSRVTCAWINGISGTAATKCWRYIN